VLEVDGILLHSQEKGEDNFKLLGVNRITIWSWVKDSRLDAQRTGGVVLIPKWEVE